MVEIFICTRGMKRGDYPFCTFWGLVFLECFFIGHFFYLIWGGKYEFDKEPIIKSFLSMYRIFSPKKGTK